MSTPIIAPAEDREWYGLAIRHLRMAWRLDRDGFYDGAAFHTYHAFECFVSAFIAAKGYRVPPDGVVHAKGPSGKRQVHYPSPRGPIKEGSTHRARLLIFDSLADKTQGYYQDFASLKRFLSPMRNDSLYYDSMLNQSPVTRFTAMTLLGAGNTVLRFGRGLRGAIG